MCGIVGGYWRKPDSKLQSRLQSALVQLEHRGPDDAGFELTENNEGTVALGHTRLSIIDLSSAGHQPMLSADKRFVLIFNGEIYNYRELRIELSNLGCKFVTQTDTEVLLQAWIVWGASCLQRFIGMFAFVVHDRKQHTLTCVRDAFGIKPFFYSCNSHSFEFASEVSALSTLSGRKQRANWQRCYDYLVHGDYDSSAHTFIEGINHLMPAHFIIFDIAKARCSEPVAWWHPEVKQATNTMSFNESSEMVRERFLEDIKLHLRSDVNSGVALSGGIDSSAVACAIRYLEPDVDLHTFSYVSSDPNQSEERWINRVNTNVAAIPHKISASSKELSRDLEDMILAQGEPFGSSSIYAQYRIFEGVKRAGVTVILEGQGADELLAGYIGYPGNRLLSLLEDGHFIDALSFSQNWSRWPGRSYKDAWMYLGKTILPDGIFKYARRMYGRNTSPQWLKSDLLAEASVKTAEIRNKLSREAKGRRVIEQLCYSIRKRGLPGLLRHADRNAMRYSVESRVPFLTIPMVELLFSLPEEYLISNKGQTKNIFRSAMKGIVPDDILYRKDKIGFATPEKNWLLSIAPEVRNWLFASHKIPFIDCDALVRSFDILAEGNARFDWQVWRWINFVKWYQCTFEE